MPEFTLEEVTRAAKEARALVAAHERRSPTSKNATLGENDALFALHLTLKRMFDRINRGAEDSQQRPQQ